MSTVRKTITLTNAQDTWVKAQIANGDYTNDSEYFRDLIRRDQDRSRLLKAAIEDGLSSGVSELGLEAVWTAAEARQSGQAASGGS